MTIYWLGGLGVLLVWLLLQWAGKMPSARAWHSFLDSFNSRGGNIFILACFAVYFFKHAMNLTYQVIDMSVNGTIKPDNAFALMGLQFATSSAFGGAMGALLKTMTSDSGQRRATDPSGDPAARTTQVQTQTTTSKTELPAEPAEEGGKHAE